MAVLLLLLNLPFLLLFLLVLCGRKKKKSNEGTPQTPVKIPTTSKPSKEPQKSKGPQRSKEPQISKEPPKEPRPSGSTSTHSEPASRLRRLASRQKIEEEETQETSGEVEIKLANVILSIHKAFDPRKIDTTNARWDDDDEDDEDEVYTNDPSLVAYHLRARKDYKHARKAYKMHKCTHPEKKRTEDERCDVCKAYFAWIGRLYELNYDYKTIGELTLNKIEEDYYNYGGKLPIFLENTEWIKAKEQLKKEMGEEKELDPPVGAFEDRDFNIELGSLKIELIKMKVDYWKSPDDVFRRRMAKDFAETRKLYREHDCRGLDCCSICVKYINDDWAGRLYQKVLKNEQRCPDGMKKQLEEDFFLHQQKFKGKLPVTVENRYWIKAKERISWRRAVMEKEKKKEEGQNCCPY